MAITDVTLRGRAPRLGTITLGRTMRYEKDGQSKTRPTKTERPVFHTDDKELAMAVLDRFGGEIFTDSDEWGFDVEVAETSFKCFALPAMASQWLEFWRTAECVRRCDGEQCVVLDGVRLQVSEPCACAAEMSAGDEEGRACKPHSIFPVLIELGVDYYAPWDVRATSWSSAGSIKGAIDSMIGAGLGTGIVPVTLGAKEVKIRDPKGQVQTAYEFTVQVNVGLRSLPAFKEMAATLGSGVAGALGTGDPADDEARLEALAVAPTPEAAQTAWKAILEAATDQELVQLRAAWKQKWTDADGNISRMEDLSGEDWQVWVAIVRSLV